MAVLPNARHERFAQGIAAGKTQTEAYINAGYSENGAKVSASRLLTDANIQQRIAELQNRTAKRAEITLQSLLDEAGDLQSKAADAGQYSAANGALKLKAELSGHYVQRKEDVTPRRSREQIDAQLRGLLADRDAGRNPVPLGGEAEDTERDQAVPTVPGHGTA